MPEAPTVFISYSHDSPEHKRWVAEFASKLVAHGVQTILDQWDLGLGEDVAKFMERSVSEADRVLMICTEAYVRKVNDGQGGAGFEAMIVTGELVRDLGSAKFIPIIRQSGEKPIVPPFLSTRVYADFSEGQPLDERYEEVIRELHEAPKILKPPLGQNPFKTPPSGTNPAAPTSPLNLDSSLRELQAADKTYALAHRFIEQASQTEWRRLIKNCRQAIHGEILDWRKRWLERNVPNEAESQNMVLEAATVYSPMIAIAIAGIESKRREFNNQAALIDEILHPNDWSVTGWTSVLEVPHTIAFIYQALHGAVCVDTGQLKLALDLARSKVRLLNQAKSVTLCQTPRLTGWPSGLGGNARTGWNFLLSLPISWPWLSTAFVSEDDYQVALSAYYLMLNIHELALTISQGKTAILSNQDLNLDIPLTSHFVRPELIRRAYSMLLRSPEELRLIWSQEKVSEQQMKQFWPEWIRHCSNWINQATQFEFYGEVAHKHLFVDLPPEA